MSAPSPDRRALHEFLAKHRRFLLTTHINPDGDGLGSEVAMALSGGAPAATGRILVGGREVAGLALPADPALGTTGRTARPRRGGQAA